MKRFFIFFLLCSCSYLFVACQNMSPFSQLGQPVTSTLNLIYDSDNNSVSNSTSANTSTGGNSVVPSDEVSLNE